MTKGWECPKCDAVMAPHVDVCVNCKGNNKNQKYKLHKSAPIDFTNLPFIPYHISSTGCPTCGKNNCAGHVFCNG